MTEDEARRLLQSLLAYVCAEQAAGATVVRIDRVRAQLTHLRAPQRAAHAPAAPGRGPLPRG